MKMPKFPFPTSRNNQIRQGAGLARVEESLNEIVDYLYDQQDDINAKLEAAQAAAEQAGEYAEEAFSGTPEGYEQLVSDVGDLKSAVRIIDNYTIGNYTFATGTGKQEASTTRLSTNIIFLKKGAEISFVPDGFESIYGYFPASRSSSSFIASGSWSSNQVSFTMPYDGYFEIQFRKSNNATITPEDFTGGLTIKNAYAETLQSFNGIIINPDNYPGDDSAKIQSAIDAIGSNGGTILIMRKYVLSSDLTCENNSNNSNLVRFIGIGNGSIDFQSYSIKGGNADHTDAHGNIVFDGLSCSSSTPTRSVMFDGDTLIRIYIRNCILNGFASIVRSVTTYIQSVYIDNCIIRNVTNVIVNDSTTTLYDAHITNCIIEWGTRVIVSYRSNGIWVTNNCIEGLKGTPFSFRVGACKVLISGNYIEHNGTTKSELDNGASLLSLYNSWSNEINITISENLIFQAVNHDGAIDKLIVLPGAEIVGNLVIKNNFCLAGSMLVYCATEMKFANILYYGNRTKETEYDEGQYDCSDYVTVITPAMVNALFAE